MKRYCSANSLVAGIFLLLVGSVGTAQSGSLELSGHYEVVDPPVATESPDQVEVVELFWYGCPHCFDFEPLVARWQERQPQYVKFRRLPVIFRESWEPHARAYYTAEILGIVDRIHLPLFKAMHEQRRKIMDEEELAAFFAERGVDKAEFARVYSSFAVDSLINRAKLMQRRYGVMGVPAMVINGKYRTSGSEAGSLEKVIPVVEALVAEEHKAMQAKPSSAQKE